MEDTKELKHGMLLSLCRGPQRQEVDEVRSRIGNQGEDAAAAATQADTFERAEELEGFADAWASLSEHFEVAVTALEAGEVGNGKKAKPFKGLHSKCFADQPKDGDQGRVRTGRVISILQAAGFKAESKVLDNIARDRCGVDLRDAIAELPEDGRMHFYDCPTCGASHHSTRIPAEPVEAS